MRIFNMMFSCGKGGIEQSFLDYTKGLLQQGHHVTAIVHPDAEIINELVRLRVSVKRVANFNQWDPFAVCGIKKLIESNLQPDVIIAHGNRAISLAKKANKKKRAPIVGVCHNYSIKYVRDVDAVFTVTDEIRNLVIKQGNDADKVFHMPNMIDVSSADNTIKLANKVPVIGSVGRFVNKKGFDVFIKAISILKERGVEFKAVLGGDGDLFDDLEAYAKKHNVNDVLEFAGWVEDKHKFFRKLDIFCLPSRHEPFGIVLLEAFVNRAAVVSTASEGPLEIITPDKDAVIVAIDDAEAMANAFDKLLANPELRKTMTDNAFVKVNKNYSIDNLSKYLVSILGKVVKQQKEIHKILA